MNQRPWMAAVLWAAAVYNVVWGAAVVLAAPWTLGLLGLEPGSVDDITLAFWRCIGMIVGVYGVGYAAAARDPLRHWPIVLVGFLGKIFGPVGFMQAAFIDETIPVTFGITIIPNDLIWWIPFGAILLAAWKQRSTPSP
ncbi:MAG: alkyl hydroperoxide reductase [Planctomycetota bacterium]